jgi:hypothetical protein
MIADQQTIETAKAVLNDISRDTHAFLPGNRNNPCVNSMIASRILDLVWGDWYKECISPVITAEVREHYERIEPYLDSWFKYGPATALSYLV